MSNPRAAKKSRSVVKTGHMQTRSRAHVWLWFVPLTIFFLTVIAFLPALNNGFVTWDDDKNLLENPHYRGLGWAELRWMFTTFYMSLYRPLTWITLGLDYLLWDMNPFGYHFTSLLLHAVNAVLFYLVALRLQGLALSDANAEEEFPRQIVAGFSALIFSLHPMRVEPVAWASARNDLLSGLFFLFTILCYLRAGTVGGSDTRRWLWMAAAVIVYGMSLLSKGVGITLPFVLLVIDVYPLRRLGGGAGKWFGSAARRVWWEKIPFLLLALGAGIIALLAKQEGEALKTLENYGLSSRLAQAFFGLTFYLWKTIVPVGLSPVYELPTQLNPWDWSVISSGLVILAVSLGLIMARCRWPAGLAAWISYILLLAPVLGIAQSGPQIVADRYSYLSCLGWAIVAGGAVWRPLTKSPLSRGTAIFAGAICVALLLSLGALTWQQEQVWRDSEKLWRRVLDVTPNSSIGHNNLGNILARRDKLEEAVEHYRLALEINPAYAEAHHNLAYVLATQGKLRDAIQHYRKSLELGFEYAQAYHNLANAVAEQGGLQEAIEYYRRAIELDPAFPEAHERLGVVLARRGEFEQAITHFRKVLELSPSRSKTHFYLATALAKQGLLQEAIEHFQEALTIQPSFAEAYHGLGRVMAAQGDLGKAVDLFRQAIRIQPEFAEAHQSLGQALADQGKKHEAAKHYQEALRLLRSRRQPPPSG